MRDSQIERSLASLSLIELVCPCAPRMLVALPSLRFCFLLWIMGSCHLLISRVKRPLWSPLKLLRSLRRGRHKFCAPLAFRLLRWETREPVDDWKWRLAITHKHHPLCCTSRLVGRCLSLLLCEFHIAFPMWGLPSMLITRDMHNLIRIDNPTSLTLWERDVDNAF